MKFNLIYFGENAYILKVSLNDRKNLQIQIFGAGFFFCHVVHYLFYENVFTYIIKSLIDKLGIRES